MSNALKTREEALSTLASLTPEARASVARAAKHCKKVGRSALPLILRCAESGDAKSVAECAEALERSAH